MPIGRPTGYFLVTCTVGAALFVLSLSSRGDDARPGVYASPEQAADSADFALQGEYRAQERGIQVVALGEGQFQVVLYRGGLPGEGWDGMEREVLHEDADGVRELVEGFEQVYRQSPTLGAAPPEGAVVLFDGTAETLEKYWEPGARMTEDGLLMQGCTTLETFRDFTMHIEFRLPFMPAARGQGRGNSGAYFQGRYEVQMLDSFGLEGLDNECGGLYSIKRPDLNMCFPPLAWQTYDVDFTAARFDEHGNKTANARMTLRHNGVVIHQDFELPGITPGGSGESDAPGPLHLQDHGDPVRYRNIWYIPRDADAQARRPIVPGFERFHALAGGDRLTGGELLLGELNCAACHALEEQQSSRILTRQAPILNQIGSRARPEWIRDYLLDPHQMKPGTTMPDVLGSLSEQEREQAVLALTNFLVTTGSVSEQKVDRQAAQKGEALFHEVGCTACHHPQRESSVDLTQSVSLQGIEQKYTLLSLREFLKNPHQSRPSGRMPAMPLNDEQLTEIASYLLRDASILSGPPNVHYTVYHGDWSELPDFDSLTPVDQGACFGLDLTVAGRGSTFGVRYDAWLKIDQPGNYRFFLGSDDGSRLFINGQELVDVDGLHPHTVESVRVELEAGMHPLRVEYFQAYGEWSLTLEYQGPGVARQSIEYALYPDESGVLPRRTEPVDVVLFERDPTLVAQGRELFSQFGCAACHQMQIDGQRIESLVEAPALRECRPEAGCLAGLTVAPTEEGAGSSRVPQYDLSLEQREGLLAVLRAAAPEFEQVLSPPEMLQRTMLAFNCFACHARDGLGGPTRDRNSQFVSTIPEMGDEGRIPPPLDGVGDKLNDAWLRHILQQGANDRPYMLARMPRFASEQVHRLAGVFVTLDRQPETDWPVIDDVEHRIVSTGRYLVGERALSCIKCHTFGQYPATGIQAIDLQTMTRRLRQDWFMRYLYDPQRYRPGTRMPTGYPDGVATIQDVYDGDPPRQILAMWTYLSGGTQAGIPDGVLHDPIELIPQGHPIIYRNFIEGLSPRGIAVGYPEGAHLAWDANDMSLRFIWHGKFIDASKHWVGRGSGFQRPLGDHVVRWEETMPIARLTSLADPWPDTPPRERGARFEGYHLDEDQRPSFRYVVDGLEVVDTPIPFPVSELGDAGFRRRIQLSGDGSTEALYFRAAVGNRIESTDTGYLVDGAIHVRLSGGGDSVLRTIGGRQELLVPLPLSDGKAELWQEIVW